MRTCMIFLTLAVPLSLSAQYSVVDDFYHAHSHSGNAVSLNIGNLLLTAGSWFVEEPDLKKIIRRSRRAKILYSEDKEFVTQAEIDFLQDQIHRDDFEKLVYLRHSGTRINLYAKEYRGFVRNIVFLLNEPGEFAMLSLDCKFKMEEIQDLLQAL